MYYALGYYHLSWYLSVVSVIYMVPSPLFLTSCSATMLSLYFPYSLTTLNTVPGWNIIRTFHVPKKKIRFPAWGALRGSSTLQIFYAIFFYWLKCFFNYSKMISESLYVRETFLNCPNSNFLVKSRCRFMDNMRQMLAL